MPLEQGQVLNNRYRIVSLLGQGGFGAVYRAWDINLKRPCAVKENLDATPEAQEQFERTAIILAGLRHPNLALVSDHFFIPGQGQYLVMDYVDGQDLKEILESTGKPIPEDDGVNWISQICDALAYIHNQDPPIIHRDIKPANIKITPEGKAVLVDFGIAKIYDPNLRTTAGARAVTPGYSPPEQYGMGRTGVRSDIYALGATMYTMLTDDLPPDSVDIMTESVPAPDPISTKNPKISTQVNQAVAKAMNVKRRQRFASATDFKQALTSSVETQVVHESATAKILQPAQEAAGVGAPGKDQDEVKVQTKSVRKTRTAIIAVSAIFTVILLVIGSYFVFSNLTSPEVTPTEASMAIEPAEESIPPSDDVMDQEIPIGEEIEEQAEPPLPQEPRALTIWHSWQENELASLEEVLIEFTRIHPEIPVELAFIPIESLQSEYRSAVLEGGGPNLLIGASDWGPEFYDVGVVADLRRLAIPEFLETIQPVALGTVGYHGALIGLPHTMKGIVMFRNREIIPRPMSTYDELRNVSRELSQSTDFIGAILERSFLFSGGHLMGLGGRLMDQDGYPQFNSEFGDRWLELLLNFSEAGPTVYDSDEDLQAFMDGRVGIIIDGTWNSPMLAEALGHDRLVIDPWPEPLSGFVLTENLYMNVNLSDEERERTWILMEFFFTPGIQSVLANPEKAAHIPTVHGVEVADPLLSQAIIALNTGTPYPVLPQLAAYWEPMDRALTSVFERNVNPWDALDIAEVEVVEILNEMGY